MSLTQTAIAACTDAIALARLQRDGHAWAVVAWPLPLDEQPLAAFSAAQGRQRTLLWHDGDWLLATGCAGEVTIDGPGRGTHLAQELARYESRCVIACHGEIPAELRPALPCFLTAFSFEEQAPGPSHWGPYLPGARLWLPRRLLWRRQDGSGWAIAAVSVAAKDLDPAALAERLLAEPEHTVILPRPEWPALGGDYANEVEDAVALIHDGAMRKVVLARAADEPITRDLDPAIVLLTLREPGSACTLYAHDLDGGAVFCGGSPELLFAAEGRRVTTMALAGSTRRGADPAEDAHLISTLTGATKERKEHGLVVEHLVSVLRPRSLPFTMPAAPHPRVLAHLIHLETLVSAELKQPDYLELLAALHPTPAVCGLPAATATHYIARHEKLHRGLYAGALGWLTPANARIIVPLRGAIIEPARGRARLFAGAGIVETSVPSEEFAETELKLSVMRQALGT